MRYRYTFKESYKIGISIVAATLLLLFVAITIIAGYGVHLVVAVLVPVCILGGIGSIAGIIYTIFFMDDYGAQ